MRYGKYKLFINTGFANATHKDIVDVSKEFSHEEWENMTKEDQEKFLDECVEDFVSNYIDAGWSEIDE